MQKALNPWWTLAALTLPVLIISMDNTVLSFTVPELSEAIEPTSSQLLWIVDVYSFVLAGLLVTMGSLGDRVGRRRLLMIGSFGFLVASVAAAMSTTAPQLIAARALLGIAGATLLPSTLSIIRNVFTEPRKRQTAVAIWASIFAAGGALGPIVGGFLLEHYWYGSVFLIAVPVTIALLVLGPFLVPESRDPSPGPFDIPSSLLSFAALVPVVYAVKVFAEKGPELISLVTLVVGVVCGVLFLRRQRRLADPMIDVELFRLPRFRAAVTASLVGCFSFAGSMFMLTQYLQLVVGQSPAEAALWLVPGVVVSIFCTLAAPAAAHRVGPFTVVAIGLGLISFGFIVLLTLTSTGSVAPVVIALVAMNAGFGGVGAVTIDAILSSVPPERAGAGAAVSETCNELGIALGTALLGSAVTLVYRRRLDSVPGVSAEALDHARETLGAASASAEQLGGTAGAALQQAADVAFTNGVRVASVLGALVAAAATVMTIRGLRSTDVNPDAVRV
ncbi:MFS transporter [soil metagenome]